MVRVVFVRRRPPYVLASLVVVAAIGSCVAVAALALTGARARASGLGRGLPEATGGLDVVPFPGTPDAPPGTRIDFPSLSPAQLASVRVVGSRSGPHAGTLSAQPGGRGTQFEPDRQFAPGERVSVSAALPSKAAAAEAGDLRSRSLRFSFRIARPVSARANSPASHSCARATVWHGAHCGPGTAGARRAQGPRTHTFHSAPRLHPPVVMTSGKDTDPAAGDIFLDARHSGHNGPYMLDPAGGLLWFGQIHGGAIARDVRVQRYAHHRVLTYYKGGVGVLLNEHYQRIHTVTAGDGYHRITTHEFQLTPRGTALVEVHADVRANLTSVGGPPNGVVSDSIVQEIDIATNRVVWEWNALGHLPLRDSYAPYQPSVPYDAFHLNSIQQLPGGNVLVSVRNMWAVFSIHKASGKINWELGGKHSSFSIGSGAHFEWQHDARLHGHGLLTVFDNGAGFTRNESQSRALKISLRGRTARLLQAYEHVPPVLSVSQGSVELLPDGNVFVGWGAAPTFSEYTRAGRQIFKGWFRAPVQSYRAYRTRWTGKPLWRPSIDVKQASAGKLVVYASWNGATQVARWRVLAGASKTALTHVVGAPRHGFETRIPVATTQPYVEVQALAAGYRVLATSKVVSGTGCRGPEC